ncbi:14050_t:CDS:2, partial [Dentiscutata erythropus]
SYDIYEKTVIHTTFLVEFTLRTTFLSTKNDLLSQISPNGQP